MTGAGTAGRRRRLVGLCLFCMAAVCAAWPAAGQSGGRIAGRTVDPSGAAVAGAALRLEDSAGGLVGTQSAGPDGRFVFSGLAGGLYAIEVEAEGFSAERREVSVAGREVNVTIRLRVSGVAEEITVMAAPDYAAETAVTATKTDTPLLETPQSISVITRDQLHTQDVNDLGEALRYTPGVQGEPFGFDPRFTSLQIRGFDASATGLYRDGLQLRNPGFAVGYNLEPYGAERIEVPRGPASVLYGQGSPGGLVNFVSKQPTQEHFREVEFEPGNFDRQQGKFDLSGPVTGGGALLYRVTGLLRETDTQVDFVGNDRVFVAPALTWRMRQRTSLTFLSHFQRDETRASQALPAAGTLRPNPNGEIPTNRFTGEPDVDQYDRTEYAAGYLFEHRTGGAWTLRHNLRYYEDDVDDVTVFSAGLRDDLRTLDRFVFGSDGELDGLATDQHAQARFATGALEHTVLAGLDYQNVDAASLQTFAGAPPLDLFAPVYGTPVDDPPVFLNTDTNQSQAGVYFQDQVRFFERWIVSLSGRVDWADNTTQNRLDGTRTEQDDNEFTSRVGLVYRSSFGLAPYASYSESFLPILGTGASGQPFEPERGNQFEAGLKYQPPGRNSVLTFAVFDLRRENVLTPDLTDPVNQVQTGEIRSRGVEVEGSAAFGFGLALTGSYTYLDMEILESNIPGEVGERPTQTPEHTGSLWGDYTLRKSALAGLGFGAGVRFLGSSFGDIPNTLEAPSATLADASIHYDWRAVRFTVNVQNLFDNEYIASCFTRGGEFCTFGPTRTIRGGVRYRW